MPTLTTNWQELGSATLYNNIVIKLDGRIDNQSITGNYSIAQFRIRNTGTYWRTSNGTASFTGEYDDSESCATYPSYIYDGDTIFTITKTVNHNEDGNKSINIGASVNAIINSGTRTANISQVSVAMPKINRQAILTGALDFNDESIPRMYFTNPAGFRINARLEFGTHYINRQNIDNTGEYVFTLTENERNELRQYCTGQTATIKYVIATCVEGTTESFWSTMDKTMQLVNGEPTATYTIVEQDAKVITLLSRDTSKIIKNASDLLFTITPTALKYATISSVKVNDVSATLDNNNYVLNLTDITTGTFSIVITDSRGFTTSYQPTKTLLDYINCKINTWSIERETQVSSNLVLNVNANVWNSTINGTSNTIVVKYSLDNETWTTIPSSSYTISNNVLTISNLNLNNIVSYQNTATFYIDISDLLSETKENFKISKGIETYSWGENDLQVNGDIFVANEDGENPISVLNVYSTIERKIGFWIDNKPIYRKVINTGELPNATTKQVLHGISNAKRFIKIYGYAYTPNGQTYPLPWVHINSSSYQTSLYCDSSYINITTGIDRSSVKESYVILEYTKTTDV